MSTTNTSAMKIGIAYAESNFDSKMGYALPLSYLVVLVVVEGNANLTINFKDYVLAKSDLIVLSHGDIVRIQSKSEDFMLQSYEIDRSLASEIAYHLPNQLFSFLHDYPLQKLDEQQLSFWVKQCNYILENNVLYLERIIGNHFQNLFLILAERMNNCKNLKPQKFSRKQELCWKFWELIGQYSKSNREVAFYAEKLHITPFYLAQIAKNFLNDLPKDLINRQVILDIKTQLKTTDKSIGEIAHALNFQDPSYMSRFFKRETGYSLTEFRKK